MTDAANKENEGVQNGRKRALEEQAMTTRVKGKRGRVGNKGVKRAHNQTREASAASSSDK